MLGGDNDCPTTAEGPIPEDLLEVVKPPVCLMWGTADPWEPYKVTNGARAYTDFPTSTRPGRGAPPPGGALTSCRGQAAPPIRMNSPCRRKFVRAQHARGIESCMHLLPGP